MSDLVLFWHRNDLRVSDSVGLGRAVDRSARVMGVFCFDPAILKRDDIAPARIAYLLGCLESLSRDYLASGSKLLIIYQDPAVGIPLLASALNAQAVYWHHDVELYSQTRDERVSAALQIAGVEICTAWDKLLHEPDSIRTVPIDPTQYILPFGATGIVESNQPQSMLNFDRSPSLPSNSKP